jgi:VWFA-related protein
MSAVAALIGLVAAPELWSQARGRTEGAPRMEADATVTDAAGRPVPGLSASDFEIVQSGRPQEIAAVDFETRSGAAAPFEVGLPRVKAPESHGGLLLVVVLDDLGLSPEAAKTVRRALDSLIDSGLPAGVRVAIVRTSGGNGAQEEPGTDRARLHAALEPLAEIRPGARSGAVQADLARTTLRLVLDGLKTEPGRKAVVLLSENMQLFESPVASAARLSTRANRASVVFYTADPRSLAAPAAEAPLLKQIPASTGLGGLAKDTGGIFFDSSADVAMVLARVLEDHEGYYRITWSPDAGLDESAPGNDLVKGIAVKVKRPGLYVRTRSEFPTSRAGETGGLELPMGSLLPVSILAAGAIPLRVTPLFTYIPEKGPYLDVLLHIDSRGLTFTRSLAGVHNAEIDMVAATVSPDDHLLQTQERSFALHIPDKAFAADVAGGIIFPLRLPTLPPGPVLVEAVVRDPACGQVGSARQVFDFPDVKTGKLLLTSIVLGAAGVAAGQPGQNAAERIFRRGTTVAFTYTILNALSNGAKQTQVQIADRIDYKGQVVYSTGPSAVSWAATPEPKAYARTEGLKLRDDALPGHYVLTVTAVDEAAPARPTATQSIDFEVR